MLCCFRSALAPVTDENVVLPAVLSVRYFANRSSKSFLTYTLESVFGNNDYFQDHDVVTGRAEDVIVVEADDCVVVEAGQFLAREDVGEEELALRVSKLGDAF